jgi:1,3-beta-glucanosyltransferase GAS5
MSEFGCTKNRPRQFKELTDLYSPQMTPVYSGGIVYEYTQGENDYGIVSVKGNTVEELPEFSILKDAFKKAAAPTGDGGYSPTGHSSECPPTNTAEWVVQNNTVPAIPKGAEKFLKEGAGKGKGLVTGDDGSQWTGTPSGTWETPGKTLVSSDNKEKKSGADKTIPGLVLIALGVIGQVFFF